MNSFSLFFFIIALLSFTIGIVKQQKQKKNCKINYIYKSPTKTKKKKINLKAKFSSMFNNSSVWISYPTKTN